jgi:GT2 family glycosyltransferase
MRMHGSRLTGSDQSDVRAADLAIVIPTRDRWEILEETLEALDAQTEQGFETIVAIDGTDQEVPDALSGLAHVRTVVQEHAGPGAARNLAVAATERPLLLFLGDDMVPAATLVARHLEHHREDPSPEVAVLGHVEWHPQVARDRVLRWLDWSSSQFDYRALEGYGGQDVGFGRLYASNVSLKRELFERAGGFDLDFGTADYEDIELGWRLHQLGLRLLYEPNAIAYHLHRYGWSEIERRYANRARAERVMLAKHEWFSPWFHDRIEAARRQPRASAIWPRLVDHVPPRSGRLRAWVEARADRWYHQQLATSFLDAWDER